MLRVVTGDQSRELKIEKIIKNIKEKNLNIQEKLFDVLLGEESEFLQIASTNSIFGGKELLILKRGEHIKKIDEFLKGLKKFDLSNKELLISIETNEKGLGKKTIEIVKSFAELYEELEVKKNSKELIENIKEQLKVDNKVASELLIMIGDNVIKLKNELEKLKNFFYGREFNLEEAKKIISINMEYNIFEQVDKLLKGDKKSIQEYLKKEKNGQLFLFWLGQELKELLKLSLLVAEGKLIQTNNYNQFKNKFDENSSFFTGKHPYRIFKTMENLKYFDIKKLKFLLKEILEVEYKIKSGFSDEEILIDILIFKV